MSGKTGIVRACVCCWQVCGFYDRTHHSNVQQVRVKRAPWVVMEVLAQQLSFQTCVFVHVITILILSAGVITDEATDPW